MVSPKPTANIFKTVGNRNYMYDETDLFYEYLSSISVV
jgi:hypothetical protein